MMITATSTSLLEGLKDNRNEEVWQTFYARYQPLLVSFGKRLGLREDDAHDAAQEALMAFTTAYQEGRYDPVKGRLRTWLSAIATNKIRDIQRRQGRGVQVAGQDGETALFDQIPGDNDFSQLWETEWQNAMLKACFDELRQQVETHTFQAFELVTIKEWPPERVAEHLKITVDSVYQAKTRCLTRMRKIHAYMEANW